MTQNDFNPYVGPRPFERKQEDAARFFGRKQETEEIVSLIFGHPVTLVYAQSGAGKTSLFNASVTTNLEENGFEVLPLTRVGGVVPKGILLKEIKNLYVFNALLKIDSDSYPRTLVSTTLCKFLEKRVREQDEMSQPRPRVLIFDQFEELFTYTPEKWREQRVGFFEQVVEALNADPLLRVVFVIREDFLAELDPYARTLPEHLRTRYRLERLGESAALQAIKDPLANTSRKFAPGVAEGLVKELLIMKAVDATGKTAEIEGQYVEPVQLQVVCVTLWSTLGPDVTEIDKTHLKNFNVSDALSNFYKLAVDATTKETNVSETDLRNWFGKTLITPMGTRSTVFRGEETTGSIPNTAVDFLESRHIIRAEFRAGARWYELTHDRLVEPILASNQKWMEALSPLQQHAALWNDQGGNETWLFSDQALIEVEQWAKDNPGEVGETEEQFLAASRKFQAERDERIKMRQRQSLTVVLVIISLITLALAAFGLNQSVRASNQAETAQVANTKAADALNIANTAQASALDQAALARSSQLSQLAKNQLNSNPALAILFSVQAFRTDQNQQSRSAMLTALQEFSNIRGYLNPDIPPDEVVISPDGSLIASRDKRGITLWEADTLKPINPNPVNGHFSSVYSVRFSPDGKTLASGGLDGSIVLWDVETHQPLGPPLLGHTSGIWGIAFTPDGKIMASGSMDSTIILWDVEKREQIGLPLRGHTSEIVSIDISPNGSILASGSGDGTIRLWNMATHRPIGEPLKASTSVWAVAFSPDGQTLASGSSDGTLLLWDTSTRKTIGEPLKGHTEAVRCLAFSPDGVTLASGGYDDVVMLWDTKNQVSIGEITDFKTSLFNLAFRNDGEVLAAASYDGLVSLYETDQLTMIGEPFSVQKSAVFDIDFDPEGNRLATGNTDSTIAIWDVSNVQTPKNIDPVLKGHPGQPTSILFDKSGKYLLSYGTDGTAVYGIDTRILSEPIAYQAFSQDGTFLVYESKDDTTGDSLLKLMDTKTGNQLGRAIPGVYVLLSEDGKFLISSLSDEEKSGTMLGIWDTTTGLQIGGDIQGSYTAISANQQVLVTTIYEAENQRVGVWDTQTGNQLGDFISQTFADISKDGKILVTSFYDSSTNQQSANLWNTETMTPIGSPIMGSYIDMSGDGKTIITSTFDENSGLSSINLWDTGSGAEIDALENYTYQALSSDGNMLVLSTVDDQIGTEALALWDLGQRSQRGDFIQGIYRGISNDGQTLLVSVRGDEIEDLKLSLWDVATTKQIGGLITGSYLSFGMDNKTLVIEDSTSGESKISFWDTDTGTQIGDSVSGTYMAVSPDGEFVLLRSIGNVVTVRDISTWSLGTPLEGAARGVENAAISPDGQLLALYYRNEISLQWTNGSIAPKTLTIPEDRIINSMNISPDKETLAYCDDTGMTTLWNLNTQTQVGETLQGCQPLFSPDGKYLALSDSETRETYLWSLSPRSISNVATIPGLQASFSSNGNNLLTVGITGLGSQSESGDTLSSPPTASPTPEPLSPTVTPTISAGSTNTEQNGSLTIWNIQNMPPVRKNDKELPCVTAEEICIRAFFNPIDNNQVIYSDGGDVFTWNSNDEGLSGKPELSTGKEIRSLYLILLDQNPYLITEDNDGFSTIWDMNNGIQVGEPIAGRFQLSHSNPDVHSLLYLDKNGTLIFWDLSPSLWYSQLCKVAGRNLNEKEWKQYLSNQPYPVICPQWPVMPEEVLIPNSGESKP